MFEQVRADYKRHSSSLLNPAFWAICNYRFGRWVLALKPAPLRWFASKVYGFNLFFILITCGIRLYRECTIGKDFHIIHSGNIHIHPATIIGDRCGIMHDVTIGTRMDSAAPVIGDDVFIGTGAKILGNVRIGNKALIAANSLVIKDVPDGAKAIGVPAKIKRRTLTPAPGSHNRQ